VLPDADVPVVQLSINAQKPLEYHLDLGSRLAPLRRRGVLVIGSGNVVHNLRRVDGTRPETGFDWAQRFDEAVRESMLDSPGDVLTVTGHRDFDAAVPTPDHFIPLLYLAGIAAADGRGPEVLVDGYTYGSLSMTAYVAGGGPAARPVEDLPGAAGSASLLPDPDIVPTDETNT
jgi:4,5-DOPA dioxygenase extradiol